MIFNSVTYVVFLVLTVSLYWILPRRSRLWLVFLSGCVFYGFWRIEYLPIMLISAATDYVVSLRIPRVAGRRKLALLCISLFVNLGLLLYFKYTMFFIQNGTEGLRLLGLNVPAWELNIILPLGISFYTFETISYSVDVYRGVIKPERDLVVYGAFITFFPHLVAGPIRRANELLGQLSERPPFEVNNIAIGLRRILYGLFLKVVLADNISPLVDAGFAIPTVSIGAWDVWTLAFLFGFQIYFDFSAYSHIAIGSARLMGIHFDENFNYPYAALSPKEFWRRWHISLSNWIRDYVYLPLCGIEVKKMSHGGLTLTESSPGAAARRTRALFVTWAVMGFWHGANWTFVLWGLYHAVLVYVHRTTEPLRAKLPQFVRIYVGWITTLCLAMLGWIFFRAVDVHQAFLMYGKLFQPRAYTMLGQRENTYLITALLLVMTAGAYLGHVYVIPFMKRNRYVWTVTESSALTVVIVLVIVFLRPISQFIYFQF